MHRYIYDNVFNPGLPVTVTFLRYYYLEATVHVQKHCLSTVHYCLYVYVAGQIKPWVNLFQPRSICFNLGQFDFLFCFCSKQKKFWYLRSSLHPLSSLCLHSTYFTYYSLPALPTSQPLFFFSQCLPCEP